MRQYGVVVASLVTGAAMLLPAVSPAAATTQPWAMQAPGSSGDVIATASDDEARMREIIAEADALDPEGFNERRAELGGSDGFAQIMSGSSAKARAVYLDFFVAVSTPQEIERFLINTDGKYLAVSGSGRELSVDFVDVPPMTTNALDCWQAYVASYAFFAATAAVCRVVTIASGPAGIACALAFWGIGTLPDFNDACD